jgi:glutaredoxin 3
MKQIEIYTRSYCPYSQRAKELLRIKGVRFVEYDVTADPAREQEMHVRSGRRAAPAVFAGGRLIGGCDELFECDERGELDGLLGLSNGLPR